MTNILQILDSLTRDSEQIAKMLSADADVDVIELSTVLANMLAETPALDRQVSQLPRA
jgi:hypothetical protein